MTHPDNANLNLKTLADQIHAALRAWRSEQYEGSPLRELRLVQVRIRRGETEARATQRVLMEAMEELAAYAPEQAALLRLRFEDAKSMLLVARHFNWAQATLYKQQRGAILELAKILATREAAFSQARHRLLLRDLAPLSTAPLIGTAPKIRDLIPLFASPEPPWMVGLTGMGGIGKTSLADALARQLVLDGIFERVVWVSAKQEILSVGGSVLRISGTPVLTLNALKDALIARVLHQERAAWFVPDYEQVEVLREQLGQQPHLLVLDNLETAPNVAELMPFIRTLVAPAKVILTSRVHFHDEGDVFGYTVPALTLAETHQLLQQEGQLRHIEVLASCEVPLATRIFEVVGGNPLAIRLVAGQIQWYGVERVLEDLRHASGIGDRLYRFLFEWVWHRLSESGRQLLVAMVLVPEEGVPLTRLSDLAQLPDGVIRDALDGLIAQNVVEVQTTDALPRYTIHPLTRTFLQEAILKW